MLSIMFHITWSVICLLIGSGGSLQKLSERMFLSNRRGKKYELAKTSLVYQTGEYFKNSTLHGVRYIAENGRPVFDKFLWICCTSVGGTVTLIIIVSLWEKFQTNPTITGLDTDFHNWDVEFPGVTICQENPVNMTRVEMLAESDFSHVEDQDELIDYLATIGGLNKNNLEDIELFDNKNLPKTNFRDIAIQVVNRCEDVVADCTWKGEHIDDATCCKWFRPVFTENGFCYSFNVRPSVGIFNWNGQAVTDKFTAKQIYETDPSWALGFMAKGASEVPLSIYLHSSNELPGLDINPHHTWDTRIAKITFSAKTTYTTEDTLQLSIKQRHCVFPNEVKLKSDDMYTYGGCMRDCRLEIANKLCKCVPYFYKPIKEYKQCDFEGYRCLAKLVDAIMSKTACTCELGCFNTVYEVEKLTEVNYDVDAPGLELGFVSWPMIRYKREVLFGWVDLLVSFGGIAGLFLGFSLLSGVEIIYYFTLRACCMLSREQDTLEKLKKEYEMQPKPPLDLSLTPYFMKKKGQSTEQSVATVQVRPLDEFPVRY